mmetsp:Transcript_36508/g.79529  ORF Transcript_36508/g.79529 Transcript_36508/m.79529 type:complete len:92 (+) Transcript_36508:663-938(+)
MNTIFRNKNLAGMKSEGGVMMSLILAVITIVVTTFYMAQLTNIFTNFKNKLTIETIEGIRAVKGGKLCTNNVNQQAVTNKVDLYFPGVKVD